MKTIAQLTYIPLETHNPREKVQEILEHLAQFDVKTLVADHGVTYSMYFKDCAGNSHEITSHDYDAIKKGLK